MIREFKKQAKAVLFKNYKKFLPAILVFMLMNFVLTFIELNIRELNFIDNFHQDMLIAVIYLIVLFVGVPVAEVLIYKTCINVLSPEIQNKENEFFRFENIATIVAINTIPSFIQLLHNGFDSGAFYVSMELNPLISFSISILGLIATFKFFIANYHFAKEQSSAADAIKFSFSKTKKKFIKIVILWLSFILWSLSISIIWLILSNISARVGIPSTYFILLSPFGFGINFFFIPYSYLTYTLFIEKTIVSEDSNI